MRDLPERFYGNTGGQLDGIEHRHPVVALVHGVVAVEVSRALLDQAVDVVDGSHGTRHRARRERSTPLYGERHPRRTRTLLAHNQLQGAVEALDPE